MAYKKLKSVENINNETNQTELIYVCLYKGGDFIYLMDIFYSTIIPFIIMFISTSITVFVLFKSKKRTNGVLNSRDIKYAIASIALNICFFVFVFPLTLFILLSHYLNINKRIFEFTYLILLCIYSINYANLNLFYVNVLSNSIFRNEFLKLINQHKWKNSV